MRIQWKSLRTKIAAWSFVPTFIILLVVAGVTFNAYRQVTEELVIERDWELVRLSTSQLTDVLSDYTTLLTQYTALLADLARSTATDQGDPTAQRSALKQAKSRFEVFDGGVIVLNNQGTVIAAEPARPEAIAQDWSDRPYFRQMLRFPEPVFSNIVPDGPEGAEVIVVAVPIKGDLGQFLGVIAGMFRVESAAISPLYDDITKLGIGASNDAYLVDGNGRVIYHSNTGHIGTDFSSREVVQRALSGDVGSLRTHDAENQEIVASFAPIPGTSWGLVTQESWSALISASQGHRQFLLFLLAAGVTVPTILVFFGIRRITNPIKALIHATQEVASGNFDQVVVAQTGDELEELAEQFNAMSARLQEMVNALRESETRYRTLFNGAPVGLYRSTPSGKLLDANPYMVSMLGYPNRKTLLTTSATNLYVDPDSRARWQKRLERNGFVSDFETRIQRLDGKIIWVNESARVVKDDAGQELYYEGSLEDITARKHADAERERLLTAEREQRQIAEALRQAGAALGSTLNLNEVLDRILEQVSLVVPHDAANIMLIQNHEASVFRWRGYEQFEDEASISSTSLDVDATPLLQKMQRTGQPLAIPNVERDEIWIQESMSAWIHSYAGAPIRIQDQFIGFLNVNSSTPGFFSQTDAERLQAFADQAAVAIENARLYDQAQQELDERVRAEKEVRRHRDHLEEMVDERTAALRTANEYLRAEIAERERLIAELDSFAHTVAHDLKNPLATILGYARILQDETVEKTPKVEEECRQVIVKTGVKMDNIIEELLLLAGVRKGEVKKLPLDMARIVAEAQRRLVYMIEEYEAEIVVADEWPTGLGYGPWVEEVWTNYISNAIKYGGRPPRVELGATVLEKPGDQVRFWVRDNGEGLTPEEQKKLFVSFERLDRINVKGHGLGLTIVRRIVEKLGGQVGVESEAGQGSVFYFTLPWVP